MEAMAATQGVYSRLNTRREAAVRELIAAATPPLAPNNTTSTETTLYFAMKPLISAVQIRQSSNPIGAKSGASRPEIAARILS